MKPSEQRLNETRRQHTEAIVDAAPLATIPARADARRLLLRPDLEVTELSVFTWPGYTAGRELYEEVMQSLVELADERPEAVQLMRGRTFARAVH